MEHKEVIKIGEQAHKSVQCLHCNREGNSDHFFSYAGEKGVDVYLCPECKMLINHNLTKETTNYNWVGIILTTTLAGILGGSVWYFITVLSEKEFGYIALGLGYLIGYAVIYGSGGKRGHILQLIAAIATIVTIFFSEYAIFIHFVNSYAIQHASDFTGYDLSHTVYLSPFSSLFLSSLISPIGLVIYGIGIYLAYSLPKTRKI